MNPGSRSPRDSCRRASSGIDCILQINAGMERSCSGVTINTLIGVGKPTFEAHIDFLPAGQVRTWSMLCRRRYRPTRARALSASGKACWYDGADYVRTIRRLTGLSTGQELSTGVVRPWLTLVRSVLAREIEAAVADKPKRRPLMCS